MALRKEISVPAHDRLALVPPADERVEIPPEHHTVTCLGMQPAWEDEAGHHDGEFVFYTYDNSHPLQEGEAFAEVEGTTYSPGTEETIRQDKDVYSTHRKDVHDNFYPKNKNGRKPDPRLTTGYAGSGIIVAVNGRGDLKIGDRVALKDGHKTGHRIEKWQKRTVVPPDMDPRMTSLVGQFSNIWDIPYIEASDRVYGIPLESVKDSLRDASEETKLNVLVVGAGPIGIGAAEKGRWAGAKNVVVLDNQAVRLDKAESLGFATENNGHLNPNNLDIVELETFVNQLRAQSPSETLDVLLPGEKHMKVETGEGFPIIVNTVPNDWVIAQIINKVLSHQGMLIDMSYNTRGMPNLVTGLEPHHKGLQTLVAQVNPENRPWRQRHLTPEKLSEDAIPFFQERSEDLIKLVTEITFKDAPDVIPNLRNHPEIVFLYMRPGDLSQVDAKPW
jgi:threonine dehydrogenase-like Zn-dependent dehydrogenase